MSCRVLKADHPELSALVCPCCPFHQEADADLACGAFAILLGLLERGLVSPEDIRAVTPP